MKIAGIVLIALGVVGLVYGGFSFVYPDRVVDAGPIQISVDKKKNVAIPPVAGVVAVVGGVVLLLVGRKRG